MNAVSRDADAGSRSFIRSFVTATGRDEPHHGLPSDRPRQRATSALRLYRLGAGLAWISVLTGAAVLIGYATRQAWIVKLSPGLPPMYPNAAIGLLCGGLAVLGAGRTTAVRVLASGCAVVLTAVGGIGLYLNLATAGPTWFEHLFPAGFVAATTPVGGRPVVETCVAFMLLGVSLAVGALRRFPLLGQALAVAATAVGLSAVVGYVLGVDRARVGGLFVGMALHTGIGIAALGASAILVRPAVGVLAHLLDGGVSGSMSRRLTTLVALTPVLLVTVGVVLDHVSPTRELAQSVFSVVQVGVLGVLILVPSGVVVRTERELREQYLSARRLAESAADIDVVVEAITSEMMLTEPDIPGWDTGMRHEPATGHLAGDSVQVLPPATTGGPTLLVVFDIAGHGAHSAVLAYGLRSHVAALWEQGCDLKTVVASANAKIVRRQTIATAVFLSFPAEGSTVELVNAGHPAPLHVSGGRATALGGTGPLLGLGRGVHDVRTITVHRGDLLVISTDGLSEARFHGGEQLGDGALTDLVLAHRSEGVQVIADASVDLAVEHSRGRLADDALVVVARRTAR